MKALTIFILIAYLFGSIPLYSADVVQDSANTQKVYYPFTAAELGIMAVKIDSLQQTIVGQKVIIAKYKAQKERWNLVLEADSTLVSIKDKQIKTLEEINKLQKKTWWEKCDQWVYYVFGVGTIVLSSVVIDNIK